MQVRNPRTGAFDHVIAPLDTGAIAALAANARAAQPAWAALGVDGRAAALRDLAAAISRHRDAIAAALTIDTGRRTISGIEVDGTVRSLHRWADTAAGIIAAAAGARRASATPGVEIVTQLVPYPLVGVISPWNFPLTLALIDAMPALMAGCAVVVKPSEVTPRFIRPLQAAIAEVPALAGVLHVVEGDGATGAALVGAVDFIAFTGSVATGRKVAAAAAAAFIPASLELGGKDPMLVLASADPAWAAGVALRASIVNTGQACQSIERIYVERAIAEPFLAALVAAAADVQLNTPDMASGHIGPFIFARQAEIVAAQIDEALAKGARLLSGGRIENHGGGLYLRPTIIVDVSPDMALMQEETFGPVLPVTIVDSIDQAVALANAGDFGLSAAVLAGSTAEAESVAARLNAGAVSVNDGALTSMVWDAEKSSFGASGLGPSRMGASGLTRFFRRRALLVQTDLAAPMAAYAERG